MNYITKNDLVDTINAMKKQEKSGYCTESGLYDQSATTTKARTIDAECRRLMVAWLKQLAEFCDFSHCTVAIAINILDRFVAKEPQILSSHNAAYEFQLAAMASLYTSIKIHETLALDPMTISKLSNGQFSSQEIEEMEARILTKLDWRVNAPTVMAFAEIYLQILLPSEGKTAIKELIHCQFEHAMEDCQFLGIDASKIAFTATYNAIMVTVDHSPCLGEMQQAINVNLLPFQLEEILMDHMRRSAPGLISSFKTAARPTKMQRSGQLSPRSTCQHLSPRSITMSR